jgi:hypothetical protein
MRSSLKSRFSRIRRLFPLSAGETRYGLQVNLKGEYLVNGFFRGRDSFTPNFFERFDLRVKRWPSTPLWKLLPLNANGCTDRCRNIRTLSETVAVFQTAALSGLSVSDAVGIKMG